jgi:hypothetical protein
MSEAISDLQAFRLQQTGYKRRNKTIEAICTQKTHNTRHYGKLQILLPGLAISQSFRVQLPQRTVAFKDS